MNILYIHGFASAFDANNDKVKHLSEIGTVSGPNVDYSLPKSVIADQLTKYIHDNKIDLVAGTSLGGYFAALVGPESGLPFIAINPSTHPYETLEKYKGKVKSFYDGTEFVLTDEVIASYETINYTSGFGLILLDLGDKLLDSKRTYELTKDRFSVHTFEGGSHRFTHMEEAMPLVKVFLQLAEFHVDND